MEKRILAKCGRKKAKCGRRKAPFGSQEAAILTAAGINAAASAAAAAMGASATKDAANKQAQATTAAAQRQAQAIKTQTENSKEYQLEAQNFIKEQNAESRELQKDIQMQLQMLTGQQNVNDRLEASKLVVKNGGMRKPRYSLRGNNTDFKVTDGGYMLYRGSTPEGFNLFEARGNDHEHYHKTPSGKYKTGVGIELKDKSIIELEGNQKTKQGEYLLQTPWALYAISKHTIDGFNPVKAVNEGIHPLLAFEKQEVKKKIKGVNDDGTPIGSPVKEHKAYDGTFIPTVLNMYNQTTPKLETDTIGDTAVGVASQFTNEKRSLKCGGKTRRKANNGLKWNWNTGKWEGSVANNNIQVPYAPGKQPSSTTTNTSTGENSTTRGKGFFSDWNAGNTVDLIGSDISTLGNIGGAWITAAANRSAARTIADAQNQASGIMRDAYNSLTGIDMSSIRREDYAAAHAMPALQAPVSFASGQNALVNRSLQRTLANAGKYSASGAAAQRRMAEAEVNAQDARNQIYAADQRQMQEIRQANAERVTQAAMRNAELDTQANRDYTGAYLNLLQYNNDINNQKILGAAGAMSEGAINAANAISQAQTSNAAAWASALTGSSQGFANSLSNMATRRADLANVMLGASSDSQAAYYANPRLSTTSEAKTEYDKLVAQYNSIKNSKNPGDKDTATILKRRINTIATSRGFKTY